MLIKLKDARLKVRILGDLPQGLVIRTKEGVVITTDLYLDVVLDGCVLTYSVPGGELCGTIAYNEIVAVVGVDSVTELKLSSPTFAGEPSEFNELQRAECAAVTLYDVKAVGVHDNANGVRSVDEPELYDCPLVWSGAIKTSTYDALMEFNSHREDYLGLLEHNIQDLERVVKDIFYSGDIPAQIVQYINPSPDVSVTEDVLAKSLTCIGDTPIGSTWALPTAGINIIMAALAANMCIASFQEAAGFYNITINDIRKLF